MKASEAAKISKDRSYSDYILEDWFKRIKLDASKGRNEMRIFRDGTNTLGPDAEQEVKAVLEKLGYYVHFDSMNYVVSWAGVK